MIFIYFVVRNGDDVVMSFKMCATSTDPQLRRLIIAAYFNSDVLSFDCTSSVFLVFDR